MITKMVTSMDVEGLLLGLKNSEDGGRPVDLLVYGTLGTYSPWRQ
jgi:hypothetical protein